MNITSYFRQNNFLYYGWLGHENLGDEALLVANKKLFNRHQIVPRHSKLVRFLSMNSVLVGGGTFINCPYAYPQLRPLIENRKLILFGVGVKDLQHYSGCPGYESAIEDWRTILDQAEFVGVRGPNSLEQLLSAGFPNARIVGDPVLSLSLIHI